MTIMKKTIASIITIWITFFLLGCQVDSERNQKLTMEIEQKKQSVAVLENNVREILKELRTLWLRSLKYRFSDIRPIGDQEVTLDIPEIPYVKSIRIQYKKNHLLNVTLSYKTHEKKVSPDLILYCFSSDGVNIHRQDLSYKGIFGVKNLKPGKLETQNCKIEIVSRRIPQYFLIREDK